MRGHVEMCLRAMTGFSGRFSDETEAFWRDVERQYKACNVMMIPQEHVPLWHARAVDQGISPAVSETPKYQLSPSELVDMRTKEGRELKARLATAGV